MVRLVSIFIIALICLGFVFYNHDSPIPNGVIIDKIMVTKSSHKMEVFSNNKLLKTYKIAFGRGGGDAKQWEGDKKTPEGIYTIISNNEESGYHNNLGISYPNQIDIARCKKLGKSTGGDIKIHGLKNGFGFLGGIHRLFDWTLGCIAITNSEIDELSAHTSIGTIIEIKN